MKFKGFRLLLLSCSLASGQVAAPDAKPFDFKGATLGMPLEEFKKVMAGEVIYINTGDPRKKADKSLTKSVPTPMCTDEMRGFPGDTIQLAAGEVLCNTVPAGRNPEFRKVMDTDVDGLVYRFFNGKLYRIEFTFLSIRFGLIEAGFVQKYGVPAIAEEEFQNGYGARWSGAVATWKRGEQIVKLTEGSGNGPGQHSSFGSEVLFLDQSNAPKSNSSGTHVDF